MTIKVYSDERFTEIQDLRDLWVVRRRRRRGGVSMSLMGR